MLSEKCDLTKKVNHLDGEIAGTAVVSTEAEIDERKRLYARFGAAKSDDYRRVLEERDSLLVRMVGDFAKRIIERDSRQMEV